MSKFMSIPGIKNYEIGFDRIIGRGEGRGRLGRAGKFKRLGVNQAVSESRLSYG